MIPRNGHVGTGVDDDVSRLVDSRPPELSGARGLPPAAGGPGRRPAWALVRLAVGTAAVIAVFLVAGLGALLFVVVALAIMVMLHELGHFGTAKWSGMRVTEYFVGFGPRVWSVRKGETEYGVKAIPAGGYVKIPGMTNLEDVEEEDEPRTYRQQPFSKRILVASAGSVMHFVMAFLLAYGALLYFGNPTSSARITGFVRWPGHARNAAQQAGLRVGDVVVAVDGRRLSSPDALDHAVNASPGKPVHLTVERAGRTVWLTVVPAKGQVLKDGNETLAGSAGATDQGSGKAVGLIGVSMGPVYASEGPVRGIGTAVVNVGRYTSATVAALGQRFSPSGLDSLFSQVTNSQKAAQAAKSGQRVESIVGAVHQATQAEQAGILDLIGVLIALNVVFGIINMLPMLPLDGGHVAIAVYERIRTRRGRPYYRADVTKLLPVAYAFVAVFAVIVLSAVYLDIAHPVANPFH